MTDNPYGHDEARVREEADVLLAAAFADAPYLRSGVTLNYTGYALVVRAVSTNLRSTSRTIFARLDAAFQAAGWERRFPTPYKVHAYVPGWIPRL